MKILIIALFLSSCSHYQNSNDLRKIVADLQIEVQQNREENAKLMGKIEEVSYFSNKDREEIKENLNSSNLVYEERIKQLETFVSTQKIINKEVYNLISEDNSLKINVNKHSKNFRDKNSKKHIKRLKLATKYYVEKKYQKAFDIYFDYLDKPYLVTKKTYRLILYRVSLAEYRLKEYDKSLAHFIQLYNKFFKEDDKYMASSVFHIGLLLKKKRSCLEAQKAFDQVIIDYPNHTFSKAAKKQIKELKEECKNVPIS